MRSRTGNPDESRGACRADRLQAAVGAFKRHERHDQRHRACRTWTRHVHRNHSVTVVCLPAGQTGAGLFVARLTAALSRTRVIYLGGQQDEIRFKIIGMTR